MSPEPDPWDQFLAAATPNTSRGCQPVVSALAYRAGDEWAGLAVTIILGPAGAAIEGAVGPRIVDDIGFRAFRGTVHPEKLAGLLAAIRTGRLSPDVLPEGVDLELNLAGKNGQTMSYYTPHSHKRHEGPLEYPYPHDILEAHGDYVEDWVTRGGLARLNEALPSAKEPYSGLAALASELQLGVVPEERTSRTVHIVSPIWIGWDFLEPGIVAGQLRLGIHSFWKEVGDDLVVSVISRPGDGPAWSYRSVVGSERWSVSVDGGVTRFETVLQAKGQVPAADLFLSFGGKTLDAVPVGLGSVRVLAHALFDGDFEQLRKRLNSSKQNTDNFEEGVAWLLHLCGFASVRYGHKDMQGATDVVAFREGSIAVFAECTSKLPPFEKILDLRNRAAAFQRRVKEARGSSIVLARAMFVGISRRDISDEFVARAHEERVLLVAKEDMEDLLEGAIRGEDARHAWARIVGCGPKFGPIHLE